MKLISSHEMLNILLEAQHLNVKVCNNLIQMFKNELHNESFQQLISIKHTKLPKPFINADIYIFKSGNDNKDKELMNYLKLKYGMPRAITLFIRRLENNEICELKTFGFFPIMDDDFKKVLNTNEDIELSMKIDGQNVRVFAAKTGNENDISFIICSKNNLINLTNCSGSFRPAKHLITKIVDNDELLNELESNGMCITFEYSRKNNPIFMYRAKQTSVIVTCMSKQSNIDNQILEYLTYKEIINFCNKYNIFYNPIISINSSHPFLNKLINQIDFLKVSDFYELINEYNINYTLKYTELFDDEVTEGFIIRQSNGNVIKMKTTTSWLRKKIHQFIENKKEYIEELNHYRCSNIDNHQIVKDIYETAIRSFDFKECKYNNKPDINKSIWFARQLVLIQK